MDSSDPLRPGPSEAELGADLRVLRQAIGLDLDELAARSGLDVEVLRALEAGEHGADVATLRPLAAALGVRLSVIFSLCERKVLRALGGDED